MKQLYIDNRTRLVVVEGKVMSRLLLGIIRGSIGKCFVVKHYRANKKKKLKKRIIVTRYPDMSGIVASEKQRVRRDLFKEAVVYARWIIGDAERKKAFRKSLPRKKRKHVYQAAIRLYMSRQGDKQWLRKQLAVRGMMSSGRQETMKEETVRGTYQLQGSCKFIWQKEMGMEVLERSMEKDDCLVPLRI
ncbi:hypothetical protein OCK74_26935 [Chitinophagaceae bacterium LB-8]|uniref:Uncharacterized protein n=1 Tax=Paraflavisolibacter caeni TaxID=2982496 RepID=A0A9X2Y2N1_9BACT|nr:hypothetical protein [Paraflavisolibacter caeni]MCU7552783.1 hypothetical protein [Paraflavisolibacter caeni]